MWSSGRRYTQENSTKRGGRKEKKRSPGDEGAERSRPGLAGEFEAQK